MEEKSLSSFSLKMIALITMAIDHTGAVLFPEEMAFRLIGRMSFPIYCFLLAEGFFYTSSRFRYLFRLLLLALVSEPVFDLAFFDTLWYPGHQNVFWTLSMGLAAMWVLEKMQESPAIGMILAAAFALLAELCNTDYGAFGVVLILIFSVCRSRRGTGVGAFALVNSGYALLLNPLQAAAVLSAVPIGLYNGKRGIRLPKLLFYAFYPVHLLLLFLIREALTVS